MAVSPELAGGAGFTFEGAVAAHYLVALLGEGRARGMDGGTVVRVGLQQRDLGAPLDDVVVDVVDAGGGAARLGLQSKRRLVISAVATNRDFAEVVRDCWATVCLPSFREDVDRVGAAVGQVAMEAARDLRALCEAARGSPDEADFEARLAPGGNANAGMRRIHGDVATLVAHANGGRAEPADVRRLLAHFVLVEFDFLHEGAADSADAIDRIAGCLGSKDRGLAPLVWSRLQTLAREGAATSRTFDRPALVRDVARHARLGVAPSLAGDLAAVAEFARAGIAGIPNAVGGVHVARPALARRIDEMLATARVVQVRGLAGSGKSVLLRAHAEKALARGPVLFLRSDQLEGRSWRAFGGAIGLSGAPLRSLLAEIGAAGTPTLYLDGIDRVELAQQPVVAELLGLISTDPDLADWRAVVTLRDAGVEVLRNWLGETMDALRVGTVTVGSLDGEESGELADALPRLRALLLGGGAVGEIVRRPFFAKVLAQADPAGGDGFRPGTETELADHWWARGGHDSTGAGAILRQRAILDLARARARSSSGPVRVADLATPTIAELEGFVADGILQWTSAGHELRYSHDIFFEWSFYHLLEDGGDGWPDVVRKAGEPPAVARSVELLSQARFLAGDGWRSSLPVLAAGAMRPQWLRAWLLGPVASPHFLSEPARWWAAVSADGFVLLRKALVWFQAERTTPNPNVLAAEGLDPDRRQRAADLLGWPSDLPAWMRLITFLEATMEEIPVHLYPEVLAVFEVWQRAVGFATPTSESIVVRCASWLDGIDAPERRPPAWRPPPDPTRPAVAEVTEPDRWRDVPGLGEFRDGLVDLVLGAARTYPAAAEAFLRRVGDDAELLDKDVDRVFAAAPTLAVALPDLLAEVTFAHLRDKLPEEVLAEEAERNRNAAKARSLALAKPEAERTRADRAAVDWAFHSFGHGGFGATDWMSLSLDRDVRNFAPVSPLREPFPSLFREAPDVALALVKRLCAHAVEAWRQLHQLDRDREGTPVPLVLRLPWGERVFWGGLREYLWHRDHFAPNALGSAMLALDDWIHVELGRGADPDALIRRIVEGSDCIAMLGAAVTVALESDLVSETSFSLVTSQRLFEGDQERLRQEGAAAFGARIGYDRDVDRRHGEAVAAVNSRPARGKGMAGLVALMLFGEEARAARLREAFAAFSHDPDVTYEEQRRDPRRLEARRAAAAKLAEFADPAAWVAYRTEVPDEAVVVHQPPSQSTPEAERRRQAARDGLAEQALWTSAAEAFEKGVAPDIDAFARRVALARSLDAPDLFEGPDADVEDGVRRGGVAATAALVLRFREGLDGEVLGWARGVLRRAASDPAPLDGGSAMASIPWHEAAFAARGLAADLRAGTASPDARTTLLRLVGHPLEAVGVLATAEALGLRDVHPRLGWAALHMGLALCRFPRRRWDVEDGGVPDHATRVASALADAEAVLLGDGWPSLPEPPPAWVELTVEEARERRVHRDARELSDAVDPDRIWTHSDEHWYARLASSLLGTLPVGDMLDGPERKAVLASLAGYLDWTIARNAPPWRKPGRRDKADSDLFEWTRRVGSLVGRVLSVARLDEVRGRFLDPVLAQEGEACWSLLRPLAETFVCCAVYDPPTIHSDAVRLLDACAGRLLDARALNREGYRPGELSGFDLPRLPRILMMVAVDGAGGAARFANGDWSEVGAVLPVVDRLVRTAGWSPSMMDPFLTLCERARLTYPADVFGEQVLGVLGADGSLLPGWSDAMLAARIAGLVQHFASRDAPMPADLAQSLLRLLDRLVDMGDRRAAALQLGEAFREVRLPAA